MKSPLLLSAFIALTLCGCGGNSSGGGNQTLPPPTPAAVAGKWEFVAVSTLNPGEAFPDTLVEANLSQTDTMVSAGTAATSLVPFYSNQGGYGVNLPVQNVCGGTGETVSATVSGQTFSFTLSEAGPNGTYTVTGTATINANGQVMTGTYTSAAACGFPNDAGNLTGTLIASISGTYLITFSDGSTSTATVTEDANHNVTVTGIAQGQAYTLTGEAIGGCDSVWRYSRVRAGHLLWGLPDEPVSHFVPCGQQHIDGARRFHFSEFGRSYRVGAATMKPFVASNWECAYRFNYRRRQQ